MSALLRMWQLAAVDLGLAVEGPSTIALEGGRLDVPIVIKGFGAANGMIVVTSYSDVKVHTDALVEAGFGYSVMSEPRPNEVYDRESFVELLSDWGWSGSPENQPAWVDTDGG